MKIAGIQPLSLLDYPGKPCSIIFTQGCIFRCSYCHNPELIPLDATPLRDTSEVLSFLDTRKGIIDAVCITGGEPTIQRDILSFVTTLKQLGFSVKLDTNGVRPDVIEQVIAGSLVDFFAMDLKAPWNKYQNVIRTGTSQTVEACKKTFALIQDSGIAHEFRTTILPGMHTRDDFFEMAEYVRPGEQYAIQQTSFKKTLEVLDKDAPQINADSITDELRAAFPAITILLR